MAGETIWRRFRRKATTGLGVAPPQAPANYSNGEPDTKEAEALAAALNHSAERVQNLWFSFLIFMVYLAIATGTTTHRMLFLESPLNLPVLNIPLPLLGFYILTPIIFVTFHFYMLLNLVLLARTAKSFEDALKRAFPEDGEPREAFRMRVENTLFVQLLVGGRLEREGINAKLLSLIALITLALAPVALLLMLQIKFLPYHSEAITWLHRGLLAIDLLLVWTLWPGYRRQRGERLWPKRSLWLVPAGVVSAVALVYAVAVATFPDERMYLVTGWLHRSWAAAKITPGNTLDLHGKDLISDEAKLMRSVLETLEKNQSTTGQARPAVSLPLAGRDLTGANLRYADVRNADFSGAILNYAKLDHAWAMNANFNDTQLQGASLSFAQLRGASLRFGRQLQGTSLDGVPLPGVYLYGAQLQGATLNDAQLQGATLNYADLQGASLLGAQLQGASFEFAQLQGAMLDFAKLQGASFTYAQLQGASLRRVFVWRADAREAVWGDTRVIDPETGPKTECINDYGPAVSVCSWTNASFEELKKLIAEQIPEGELRRAVMERIELKLNPAKPLDGENEMAKVWADHASSFLTKEVYEKSLAEQWRELGCGAEGAPSVLQGLVNQLIGPFTSPFGDQSDAAKALAEHFLDEAHCPGAHGLSEAAKVALKDIASAP